MSVSAYLHLDAPVSSTLLTHYCQQPSHKETFAHFWAKYYESSNCMYVGKSEYSTAIIFSFQSYPRSSFILGRETRLDLYHIAFIWKLHNMICISYTMFGEICIFIFPLEGHLLMSGLLVMAVHHFFCVRMFFDDILLCACNLVPELHFSMFCILTN